MLSTLHAIRTKWLARPLLAVAMLIWPAASTAQSDAPPSEPGGMPSGYALVWADEFDTPGLPDPARWTYDTERNAEGWWNAEAQYYSNARLENSRIEDGVLIIEARKERLDPKTFPDWGGQDYTSARLITSETASWAYGFIEVRAKLPCGRGTWPAIWTLGAEPYDHWPGGGEIDIMEHVGYDPGRVHGNVHTEAFNHTRRNGRGYAAPLPEACDAFHRYQLTWTEDEILLGFDDRNYLRIVNDANGDDDIWPFHRPQYLLLNMAIGGSWGGNEGIDDTIFPRQFLVDYVRVYQRRPPAE